MTSSRSRSDRHRPVPAVAPTRDGRSRSVGSPDTRASTLPGYMVLPLRLFLGVTFVYAGVQKLMDPGFFTAGSSTYIGSQMLGFSYHSPIKFLLSAMMEYATIVGWLIILTELAIGGLVLLGLFTRLASLIGLMLSFSLFLSATWTVYPYFLGSDIVFVAAWLTLALMGSGAFCLDTFIQRLLRRYVSDRMARLITGPLAQRPASTIPDMHATVVIPTLSSAPVRSLISRSEALIAGLATVVLLVLGLLPRNSPSGQVAAPASSTAGGTGSSGTTIPAGARKVATTAQIPVNSALATVDPKTGDPAVIVHADSANFFAYDATCTHAGCTVQYDPQSKTLVCPCHGGTFDPSRGGAVVAGPPPTPLVVLPIGVDAQGNVYLV